MLPGKRTRCCFTKSTPRLAAQEWHGQFRYWEGAATLLTGY